MDSTRWSFERLHPDCLRKAGNITEKGSNHWLVPFFFCTRQLLTGPYRGYLPNGSHADEGADEHDREHESLDLHSLRLIGEAA